ncbi:MAG: hypothetical protein IJY58_01810 [Alphaproteobacteria bacterium]|nr:hypothetical protein [Alphaproteobacteria bacterium]
MGNIKFYTIEDWVAAYLKGWGYHDEYLTHVITEKLKSEKNNLHPDDVCCLLDKHVQAYVDTLLPETTLNPVQKYHYFKMIFLMKELYLKVNLFDEISVEDERCLFDVFQKQLYPIVPDLIQANMFRQSIKTFHPFWKLKKTLVKGVKFVGKTVVKK